MAEAGALQARLVDTNVLIVASAADAGSPFGTESTPIEEAALRQQVFDWLEAFVADPTRHAVLDVDWHVCGEYRHKLTEQDYGWLAMMHKMDRGEVVWVDVLLDKNGNAVLPPELAEAVTDLADRKMVSAALAALDAGHATQITNAADTDWIDCQQALQAVGLKVENLLPAWLQARWRQKHPPLRRAKIRGSMPDFFRFPHTPHIAWLATGAPRDDATPGPQRWASRPCRACTRARSRWTSSATGCTPTTASSARATSKASWCGARTPTGWKTAQNWCVQTSRRPSKRTGRAGRWSGTGWCERQDAADAHGAAIYIKMASGDVLHNSLRSVIARPRAVRCVAFLANSPAIGCKKTPYSLSRSALPPTREGYAGHP